jgi:hypothetical protein
MKSGRLAQSELTPALANSGGRNVKSELIRTEPEKFIERFLDLEEMVVMLTGEVKELREQLKKNSKNSSKPPSSDGYEKPAPKSMRERKEERWARWSRRENLNAGGASRSHH